MITVNGRTMELDGPASVAAILKMHNFAADRVVVEKNMEIVAQKEYESTLLYDGDNLEILQFVGGG